VLVDYRGERAVEAEVSKLWAGGADFETLLGFMIEHGVSQIGSFLMLARVTGMERSKAQRLVFQSQTWADRLEANMQTQRNLIQAIKELNEEDPTVKMSFQFEPDPEDSEQRAATVLAVGPAGADLVGSGLRGDGTREWISDT
jgi:hypothetical protein